MTSALLQGAASTPVLVIDKVRLRSLIAARERPCKKYLPVFYSAAEIQTLRPVPNPAPAENSLTSSQLRNLLDQLIPAGSGGGDPKGRTVWADLADASRMPKARPWVRGRRRGGELTVNWFPRTSKAPTGDRRWTVFSPAQQLPSFQRPGWFLANMYHRRHVEADDLGDEAGVIDGLVVDALETCLKRLYWG